MGTVASPSPVISLTETWLAAAVDGRTRGAPSPRLAGTTGRSPACLPFCGWMALRELSQPSAPPTSSSQWSWPCERCALGRRGAATQFFEGGSKREPKKVKQEEKNRGRGTHGTFRRTSNYMPDLWYARAAHLRPAAKLQIKPGSVWSRRLGRSDIFA